MNAIEVDGIIVRYPGAARPALDGVTVTIPHGERWALLGPNGCGKSTLLKAIAGLLPVEAGQIRVLGERLGSRRRRVAYLPQATDVDWTFPISIRRMVLSGCYARRGWLRPPTRDDAGRAASAANQLGLAALGNRAISQLSSGQRQRLLLARAISQRAEVLLLDEPLNAVDEASEELIGQALDQLSAEGTTIFVATHHLSGLGIAPGRSVGLLEGRLSVQEHAESPHAHHA